MIHLFSDLDRFALELRRLAYAIPPGSMKIVWCGVSGWRSARTVVRRWRRGAPECRGSVAVMSRATLDKESPRCRIDVRRGGAAV